jgi:hypothetical protein
MAKLGKYDEICRNPSWRSDLVLKLNGVRNGWIECEGYEFHYFNDEELPKGKYSYYCRHKDNNQDVICGIKKNKNVTVNFWGSIVTDQPIDFGLLDEIVVTRMIDDTDNHDIVMVFGDSAADAYLCESFEAMTKIVDDGDGLIIKRHFNTCGERHAYLLGVNDGNGWDGSTYLYPADVYKHAKAINKRI